MPKVQEVESPGADQHAAVWHQSLYCCNGGPYCPTNVTEQFLHLEIKTHIEGKAESV